MNGIIIINKPKGFTSQNVVSKVKKILNEKKAGHTGTLDPLATGVLPVLIGDYTKLSKYLIDHDKKYIARIKFGEKRETGDLEGEIVKTSNVKIEDTYKIKNVLKEMIGKQTQIPPMYSAIKVNGKKLYEYARKGETVEVPAREIEIYKLDFLNFDIQNQELEIEISCSKGTYIRTLCEDISEKLGTFGYMSYLKRIAVNNFKIEDAIDLNVLDENKNNANFLKNNVITMEKLFENLPKIVLDKRRKELFLNGVMLTFHLKDGLYNIYSQDNNYIGTGILKGELLKRDIIE